MLVILSDLHLTDGTTAINVHPSAFELLGREIAETANHHDEVKSIHVVLLGDIYDLVRTSFWFKDDAGNATAQAELPWGGNLHPTTGMNDKADVVKKQFTAIANRILGTANSKALVSAIGGLAKETGRPCKVTHVIGNHDRVLHNFPSLQDQIREAFESVDPKIDVDFAREVRASEYKVLARHGHEWDENCHGWELLTKVLDEKSAVRRFDPAAYRTMAIGEVITAELMSGIVFEATKRLAGGTNDLDRLFLRSLMDVNNVRPSMDVFRWISWLTSDRFPIYARLMKEVLETALDRTLENPFAKRWDDLATDVVVSGDLTDFLSKARDIVASSSSLEKLERLGRLADAIVSAFNYVTGNSASDKDALFSGAEEEYENVESTKDVQYIVYGHTHEARQDFFTGKPDGTVKAYINTGTYLPLVDRTRDGRSFWTAHRMTMAYFFSDAEDVKGRQGPGPTVDLWNGLRRKVYESKT